MDVERNTVTGSIISNKTKFVPLIPGSLWEEMEESGCFSQLYGKSSFKIRTFPKAVLEEKTGDNPSELRGKYWLPVPAVPV